MAKLSDEDLFTLPLTFMGVPYGRPGPATEPPSWGYLSTAAFTRSASGHAAARTQCGCNRR